MLQQNHQSTSNLNELLRLFKAKWFFPNSFVAFRSIKNHWTNWRRRIILILPTPMRLKVEILIYCLTSCTVMAFLSLLHSTQRSLIRAHFYSGEENWLYLCWNWIYCVLFWIRFSMDAGINPSKIVNHINFDGATHADDLCYYFQWVTPFRMSF